LRGERADKPVPRAKNKHRDGSCEQARRRFHDTPARGVCASLPDGQKGYGWQLDMQCSSKERLHCQVRISWQIPIRLPLAGEGGPRTWFILPVCKPRKMAATSLARPLFNLSSLSRWRGGEPDGPGRAACDPGQPHPGMGKDRPGLSEGFAMLLSGFQMDTKRLDDVSAVRCQHVPACRGQCFP
jgi:hypothetical protein